MATKLKLCAIDVGFDLRIHDEIDVFVPPDTESAEIDIDGGRRTISGTRDEIVEALKAAGYHVAAK